MNKKVKYVLPALVAVLVSGSALAAKPDDTTKMHFGNAFGKMTKEEKTAAQQTNRPVQQFRMYDFTGTAPATYDYENKPWGMIVANTKRGMVNFVGHHLEANTKYTLYFSGQVVGVETTSNMFGGLHLRAKYTPDSTKTATDWVLKKGDQVVLTGSTVKVKGVESSTDTDKE